MRDDHASMTRRRILWLALVACTASAAAQEDARCLCLVYLVLKSGLKKEEVMGLKVHHVDLDDPAVPMVTVRFSAMSRT